ncbi:MAG TPA: RNA polymerase factor sigma-54 [Alphaproteobacteria bacterium]
MSTPQRQNKSSKGPQGPHLALKQTQTLTMTPQLQQAIALLQMNNIELNEFVLGELESNPLLQRADENDGDGDFAAAGQDHKEHDFHHLSNYAAPDERTKAVPEQRAADASMNDEFDRQYDDHEPDTDYDSNHTNFSDVGRGGRDHGDGETSWEQQMGDASPSLYEHLTKQIQLEFASPQDQMLALALVENLDEAGYFRGSIKKIAEQFVADIEDVELVLARCQQMEPAGLFALNLAQCLELQLKDQGILTPEFQVLLANLALMGQHDYRKLQQKCGVGEDEFRRMLVQLKRLDPKPALLFTHDVVQTLIPDVIMKRNRNPQQPGTWMVELNPDALPKVLVNQRYAAIVQQKGGAKEKKKDKEAETPQTEYLIDKLQSAQFLIKALDQRAQSILKIASEIVRQQDAFFAYGVAYLKPLILRDIAAVVEVHESTVSRITTQKYIETPRGVFELKYFFSSHVGGGTGTMEHTAHAVKARIKQLVDVEDAKKILSDDDLVELLKVEGIPIARRTVTKYREAMNIGSSVARRRQKNPLR